MSSLREFYDRIHAEDAVQWAPLVLRPNAISTTRWDDAARLLAREKGRMLDLGCGAGQFALAMAGQFDEVVGIDLSPVRIGAAEKALAERYPQFKSKVRFQAIDAEKPLPFPEGHFNAVVALCVLEHVVDVFRLVDEIARVTARGGCAVISVPNICFLRHMWNLLWGRVPVTGDGPRDAKSWRKLGWDSGHLHYFTKSLLADVLQYVGLKAEKWSGDGRFAKLRRWRQNLMGDLNVRARKL